MSAQNPSAYSFQNITASLSGPTGVVNFGYGAAVAGEGIEITMDTEKVTKTIGADGKGMYSLKANNAGKIKVNLLQTSDENSALMAIYDSQSLSAALCGQNTITVQNSAGSDVWTATQVAFTKRPDYNYKEEGAIVTWEFEAIQIQGAVGTY